MVLMDSKELYMTISLTSLSFCLPKMADILGLRGAK